MNNNQPMADVINNYKQDCVYPQLKPCCFLIGQRYNKTCSWCTTINFVNQLSTDCDAKHYYDSRDFWAESRGKYISPGPRLGELSKPSHDYTALVALNKPWHRKQLYTLQWTVWRNTQWATSYQIHKIVGCACVGNAGNVFPANNPKGNR